MPPPRRRATMLSITRPALGVLPWGVSASGYFELRLTTENLSFFQKRSRIKHQLSYGNPQSALTLYFNLNRAKRTLIFLTYTRWRLLVQLVCWRLRLLFRGRPRNGWWRSARCCPAAASKTMVVLPQRRGSACKTSPTRRRRVQVSHQRMPSVCSNLTCISVKNWKRNDDGAYRVKCHIKQQNKYRE